MTSPLARLSLATATLAVLVAAAPVDASALPISYFFRGIGSGAVGTQAFSDAAFEIEVQADTAAIVLGGPFVDWNDGINVTVTIAGIGTVTYGDGFGVFVNRDVESVGFGEYQGPDRLDVVNGVLATYALDQEIGPIAVTLDFLGQFPPGGDPTSGGAFLLRTANELTFEARLTEASDVVEPATTAAFAAGLVALGFARRRRA